MDCSGQTPSALHVQRCARTFAGLKYPYKLQSLWTHAAGEAPMIHGSTTAHVA